MSGTVTFTATVSGSAPTPIVPNVVYDQAFFTSVSVTPSGGNAYVVTAIINPNGPGGGVMTPITVRLCQDAACVTPYANAQAAHSVAASVTLDEWTTYQRNAAHTGFVNARLDVRRFSRAWEWTTTEPSAFTNFAIPVSGSAYLATSEKVYSLNELSGTVNWVHTPPFQVRANGHGVPTVHGRNVYVPTMYETVGSVFTGEALIRGFDAMTGALSSEAVFQTQGGPLNSATIVDGAMFLSTENRAFGYESPFSPSWAWQVGGLSNYSLAQSPAVDDRYVYHATGGGVSILNKTDGSLVADTGLPPGSGGGPLTSPVLTPSGLVLTFDIFDNGRLLAVRTPSAAIAWRGETSQGPQPVVAGDTIYNWHFDAGRYSIKSINAADGAVKWSWPLPSTDTDVFWTMVVTENLLFVSSTRATYAIDLATQQTVWTASAKGKLTMSSALVLYVVDSDFGASTKVTAFRLAG